MITPVWKYLTWVWSQSDFWFLLFPLIYLHLMLHSMTKFQYLRNRCSNAQLWVVCATTSALPDGCRTLFLGQPFNYNEAKINVNVWFSCDKSWIREIYSQSTYLFFQFWSITISFRLYETLPKMFNNLFRIFCCFLPDAWCFSIVSPYKKNKK